MVANGPANPRPPMTFEQQADLLMYLHGKVSPGRDGKLWLTISFELDQAQVDDLYMTAARLRRMAPLEAEIKDLVMNR